uniref:4-phosphopantoate--beta-alanine ligase n=2 Tax=environmental samples TaxID=651140 RepID=A0A075HJ45_9ARCH|nr:4-phosphopantoate---beta-alanine ligase (pps) [uncultured marine thaumarchaeote KM3_196_E01]AIF13943.1 4-phosphopantoate---beta-alanine ligase (pps) [uncultured marine thaumarchaeote KM3_65_D04]
MKIPKSHPRFVSLSIREKIVKGYNDGLVAKEGLLAHGRGEAFDYLVGEKTTRTAKAAINAAAATLLSAQSPVISVNGNVAALCPKEIVQLAKATKAKIEVNLFYYDENRKKKIVKSLKNAGAKQVLGTNPRSYRRIGELDSPRRIVDKDGIFTADVILVPLEDGDRTEALQKIGKTVITFDLNPLSRTAQKADITIVDNVIRGMRLLVSACKKSKTAKTNFNNKRALSTAISEIKNNLKRRGSLA